MKPWKLDENDGFTMVYPEKMDEHGWILRSAFLLEIFLGWHFFTVFFVDLNDAEIGIGHRAFHRNTGFHLRWRFFSE